MYKTCKWHHWHFRLIQQVTIHLWLVTNLWQGIRYVDSILLELPARVTYIGVMTSFLLAAFSWDYCSFMLSGFPFFGHCWYFQDLLFAKIVAFCCYLTQEACKTLVLGLAFSHLDYCNTLFIELPDSDIRYLQKVLNILAKPILNCTNI